MNVAVPAAPRDVLGHPRGLVILFFAEMWERFSFYGMRALLIFYLTQHFLFDDAMSAGIYASYGAMVYLMPVIGGMVADRYLGFRKAVVVGAILLCIGHLGMAFEGDPARTVDGVVVRDSVSLQVLYLSLAFIVIGVGFLKSSISNMVGMLYAPGDSRRDGGFTLFYMGINLGAFVAGLVCGYLGQTYGWRYGFGLAGIGMLAGLFTFVRGRRLLMGAGEPPESADLARPILAGITREQLIWGGALVAVVVAWQILQYQDVVGGLLLVGAGAVVIGLIWFSLARCTPVDRDRTLVVLGLTAVAVVFWALFEQAGSSMSLFADRNVDRDIVGATVQASQFQSLNPLFIIFLAPLFAGLWPMLARRGLGTGHAGEIRPRDRAGGTRLRRAGLRLYRRGRGSPRGGRMARLGVSAAHHRRALSLPRRTVRGHEALGRPDRGHDDGRMVPRGGRRELRRRPDRGGRERRHERRTRPCGIARHLCGDVRVPGRGRPRRRRGGTRRGAVGTAPHARRRDARQRRVTAR